MFVIKRKGIREEVNFDKINMRIKWLVHEPYELKNVKASQLAQKVIQSLYDGMRTTEIDNYTANLAASLSIEHRDYGVLAGRIVINNCHKNTLKSFKDKMNKLYMRTDVSGRICPLIGNEFYKFVEKNQDVIESEIDYSRDYFIDFFGFRTLEKGYLLKIDDKIVERPQDLFMRVAVFMHMNPRDYKSNSALKQIFETYHLMSQKYFIHATPTLFNAGTVRPALASCFLLGTEDSLEGIMDTATNCANISKWAGGVGFHFSNWRSEGSLIRSTNGKSGGTIPFLRIFNDIARAFNQGGKRLGSFAAYIEPHHPDIMSFLNLRRNHGDENLRTRDLFLALWISDIFMERVQSNGKWYTFDPDECPGLTESYGEEYTKLYQQYEEQKKYSAEYNAREVWQAIFTSQKEAGMPYMLYKDNVNRHNNQSNMGVIKSSNLCCEITIYSDAKEYGTCFTGDTQVLTKNGYKRIDECDGNEVLSCYNNDIDLEYKEQFIEAKLIDNGIKDVYELDCTKIDNIKATEDHLFLILESRNKNTKINNYQWKKLKELDVGDKIILPNNKVLPSYDIDIKQDFDENYLTIGWILGDGWFCQDKDNKITCGVCFGPHEEYTRERVIKHLTQLCNNTEFKKYGSHKSNINYYTDKNGVYNWASTKQNFTKYITDNYGLQPCTATEKIITEKIKNANPNQIASVLCGLFCADGSVYIKKPSDRNNERFYITLASSSKKMIYEVQRLLHCFGIESNIVWHYLKSRDRYQEKLVIENRISIERYKKYIGFELSPHKQEKMELGLNTISRDRNAFREYVKVKSVKYLGQEKVFDLNVPDTHNFIVNGLVVHNCHLSSICLPKFVEDTYTEEELLIDSDIRRSLNHEFPENPKLDYENLSRIAGIVCRNLNKVIDNNLYPCPEAKASSMRGRPIGIGVQGLADVFYKFKTPFDSDFAKSLNKKIFEAIYFGALSASTELSKKEYQKINKSSESKTQKTVGSYPAYLENGGSPLANGMFHWEMYGLEEKDLSGMFDWATLREHIQTFGIRNSLLTALMPTASTSHLNGNIECFEPLTSNIYKRKVLSGEFIVINKYMVRDLMEMKLWNQDIINYLKISGGSIQGIEGLPDKFKQLYRTAWEVPQKSIIDMCIDRQPFVDQSQSMNLFFQDYTFDKFSSAQFYAWKNKLKTGSYYIRTQASVPPQKFTVNPDDAKSLESFKVNLQDNLTVMNDDEICLLCSS